MIQIEEVLGKFLTSYGITRTGILMVECKVVFLSEWFRKMCEMEEEMLIALLNTWEQIGYAVLILPKKYLRFNTI